MLKKKIRLKLLITGICLVFVSLLNNNTVFSVKLDDVVRINENVALVNRAEKRTYNTNSTGSSSTPIFVYKMKDKNGNLVFCIEPGKKANKNIEYSISETLESEDKDKILSHNDVIYEYGGFKTEGFSTLELFKLVASEIYSYNNDYSQDKKIVAQQILIWRMAEYIYQCREYTKMDFTAESLDLELLKQDAESILLGAGTEVQNIFRQKLSDLNKKLAKKYFGNLVSNIFPSLSYSKIQDGVTFYKATSGYGGYGVNMMQILIGPPIETPEETPTSYDYNYIYRYFDTDGTCLKSDIIETGTYTTSKTISYGGSTITDGSDTYTFVRGEEVAYTTDPTWGMGTANDYTEITISGGNKSVIFYYQRQRRQTSIKIYQKWTKSNGKTYYLTPGATSETENKVVYETHPVNSSTISGIAVWKPEYYIEADDGDKELTIELNENKNGINISNIPEGETIEITIVHKSKKVLINLVSFKEDSQKTSTSYRDSGEISLNTNPTYNVLDKDESSIPQTENTIPIKHNDLWYIGYKLYKSNSFNTSLNWKIKTIGDKTGSECAVYKYDVYYEDRIVYKKYSLTGKTLTTISKNRDKVLSNPERISNGIQSFGIDLSIVNSNETLYAKINSYYEKIVFNNDFRLGNAKTKEDDNSTENRKKRAENESISSTLKDYLNDNLRVIPKLVSDNTFSHSDTSVINFYYEVEQPVTVLVRHIVNNKNGTYTVSNSENLSFLRNADEKYYDSVMDKNRIVSNGYNQRKYHANASSYKDTVPSGFSEKFTIDKDDKLYLDKSRTLLYNGVQYVYKGYNTHKAYNINNTSNKLDINISGITTQNINNSIEVSSNGNTNRTIYVDFYYEESDYSTTTVSTPDPDPTPDDNPNDENPDPNVDPDKKYTSLELKASPELKFRSENVSGQNLENDWDDSNKKIAYVPAGEKLKPYFETASYVPYVLSYKLILEDGDFKYELDDFNVYQLLNNGHQVINKNFASNSDAVMVGNSTLNVIFDGNVTGSNIVQAHTETEKLQYKNLGIYATDIPVGQNTTIDNFTGTKDVSSNKYNGLRLGDGAVQYRIERISGDNSNNYYSINNVNVVDSMDVNVYTPMVTDTPAINSSSNGLVDHRPNTDSTLDSTVIQKGVEFTLTPKIKVDEKCEYNDNLPNLDKYLQGAYVVFEFDVQRNGTTIPAGQATWIPKKADGTLESITVTPVNTDNETSIKQLQEKITTVAVTINADGLIENQFENNVKTFLGDSTLVAKNKTNMMTRYFSQENYYEKYGINMYADSHYFVKNETATIVLARLYDFKITDCYDVDFKNVFRKSGNNNNSTPNAVNDLTGICYYSGKNKVLLQYALDAYTTRSENTLLPLGPYKHTQYDYVKAPKLGYRVSFDVKTYGYYNEQAEQAKGKDAIRNTRKIKITPSYYYIGKDGSGFTKDIKLYYKNSSGKYVKFGTNSSTYNISFKPNDGYRNLSNVSETPDTTWLSDKLVNIKVGSTFTLEPSTMMTTSNDNFIQTWYGEFKVPNSTIVIKDDGNLNNPLKDGYLGVIFKIECIDSEGNTNTTNKSITVLYDTNDRNKSGFNTSQWDYEGYMGVKAGQEYSTSLQLEKGTWNIEEGTYKEIKGTVVLFDLDERASNDFD